MRSFCENCAYFCGCERDLKWHNCRKPWKNIGRNHAYVIYDMDKVNYERFSHSLKMAIKTTLYFIFTFKPIFSKDITLKIAKLIYNTRYEAPLWYIFEKKRKRKIKHNFSDTYNIF
jgi:hypothetical protein